MSDIVFSKVEGTACGIPTQRLNRHGAVFGATGTGKTVTLKVLAEQMSKAGIPVFLADVKGDLSGFLAPIEMTSKIQERVENLQQESYTPRTFPVEFFDIFGEKGIPFRTTISEMGPLLLSRALGLNSTQEGILNICFTVADERNLLLIDCKDLRSMLSYVQEERKELAKEYGAISSTSISAILRALLLLEKQGGDIFFAEPSFVLSDLLQTENEEGKINILQAQRLFTSPRLYSAFLLWLLSALYAELPEVGDAEKPKLVLFFDEAHLLFDGLSDTLQSQMEQMIRLCRSKGISLFFLSQNPTDIPDAILSQCGNKIQHALRAYTPKEQESLRKIAKTFRQDGQENLEEVISSLKVGEALFSYVCEDGSPSVAKHSFIYAPESSIAPVSESEIQRCVRQSDLLAKYEQGIDRESAYEILSRRIEEDSEKEAPSKPAYRGRSGAQRFTDSVLHSIGREIGRQISRSLLGIFKK